MSKHRKPRSDGEYAHAIYNHIKRHPGKKPFAIAKDLGTENPSNIYARLTTLDNFNLLLYEDDKGRLYVFDEDCF